MTPQDMPRRLWPSVFGGLAGVLVGAGWTWLARVVVLAIDDAGFHWPLPFPLAILATVVVVVAMWVPWIPLFLRVGFPWWFVIVGVIPFVGIALAGSVGARLATGTGRPPKHERPELPAEVVETV